VQVGLVPTQPSRYGLGQFDLFGTKPTKSNPVRYQTNSIADSMAGLALELILCIVFRTSPSQYEPGKPAEKIAGLIKPAIESVW
jgi:hypothetical protein